MQTAKHQAQLPKSSLTISGGKALFGLTQAELDAPVENTLSTMSAELMSGATVKARGGENVGAIEAIDAQTVRGARGAGQDIPAIRLRGTTPSGGYARIELRRRVISGFISDQ